MSAHRGGFSGGGFSPLCAVRVSALIDNTYVNYNIAGGNLSWSVADGCFHIDLVEPVAENELAWLDGQGMTNPDTPAPSSVIVQRVSSTRLRVDQVSELDVDATDHGWSLFIFRLAGAQGTLELS